jgi:hypothetical protein
MMFRECEHEVITRFLVDTAGLRRQLRKSIARRHNMHQNRCLKFGPGVPWPDSYHSLAANGPLGPNVPTYLNKNRSTIVEW